MITNIYAVGQNTLDEGFVVPVQVELPENIKQKDNIYYFGNIPDALRFYEAIYTNKHISNENMMKAFRNATTCNHDDTSQCNCFERWKEDVASKKTWPISKFRKECRNQDELHYAVFIWQPRHGDAVQYMITFKQSWSIKKHDKTVNITTIIQNLKQI